MSSNQKEPSPSDYFPTLDNADGLNNDRSANSDDNDDDDDDVDAMFSKYLGDMDAEQLRQLMAMGGGGGVGGESGGGGGEGALDGLGRGGGDASSDDDNMAVEERIGKLRASPTKKTKKKTANKKSATTAGVLATHEAKKKEGASLKAGGGGTTKKRSSSSSSSAQQKDTTPAKPCSSTSKSLSAAVTAPPRRSLSGVRGPSKVTTPSTTATTVNTTVLTSNRGPPIASTLRKALPNSSSAATASAAPSSTVLPTLRKTTSPTTPGNASPPPPPPASSGLVDDYSIEDYKALIKQSEENGGEGEDEGEGGGARAIGEDDDAAVEEEGRGDLGARRVPKTKRSEPFRYEAPITGRYGNPTSNTAEKSSGGVSTNQKKAQQRTTAASHQPPHAFTFQDLVAAVLTAEERASHNTPEQVSEALAVAKIVDLSDKGLKDSDDCMCLDSVTHLYVQHNALSEVEGFAALMHLTVLIISHNDIESLAPLATLEHIMFLDASFNKIEALDASAHLPTERLRELRLEGNPCAPDYALLEAFTENDNTMLGGGGGDEDEEEDVEGHFDYLEQYRSEILSACPLLLFLDGYEVKSFAPEHIAAMEEDQLNSGHHLLTMLAANEKGGGKGNRAAVGDADDGSASDLLRTETEMMAEAEEAIDAVLRADMDLDRDEEVLAGSSANAMSTAAGGFDALPNQRPSSAGNGSGGGGGGLSELQERLMEAYLSGSVGDGGGKGSRPTTASAIVASASSLSLRPGSAMRGGASDPHRPGTSGASRPSSAMVVAALGNGGDKDGDDEGSSSDEDEAAMRNKKSNNKATRNDPLAVKRMGGGSGGAVAKGRVGSSADVAPPTSSSGPYSSSAAFTAPEDKAYAKLSDRQRDLAKELAIAQRHRDKLAELSLMEYWDEATSSLRELRSKVEERRRQLLFASPTDPQPPNFVSASSSSALSRLQLALQQSAMGSTSSPLSSSQNAEKMGSSSAAAKHVDSVEMQHSAGYLEALERLRKDASVVGDINRYRTTQPQNCESRLILE